MLLELVVGSIEDSDGGLWVSFQAQRLGLHRLHTRVASPEQEGLICYSAGHGHIPQGKGESPLHPHGAEQLLAILGRHPQVVPSTVEIARGERHIGHDGMSAPRARAQREALDGRRVGCVEVARVEVIVDQVDPEQHLVLTGEF